MLKPG